MNWPSRVCVSWELYAFLSPGALAHAEEVSSPRFPQDDYVHSESFLQTLMRRQLRLSVACALTFLVALLGLPLLNYFLPEAMSTRVGGFPLSWLLLGVLFFPFVWGIAWVFIRRSIALEQSEVEDAARSSHPKAGSVVAPSDR
jgi:uncharacterized membrane protein (DUF485 family)